MNTIGSHRVSIRFNPEYDQDLINKMKQYNNRNLSKILRAMIREGFNKLNQNQNQPKIEKWNFPNKEK